MNLLGRDTLAASCGDCAEMCDCDEGGLIGLDWGFSPGLIDRTVLWIAGRVFRNYANAVYRMVFSFVPLARMGRSTSFGVCSDSGCWLAALCCRLGLVDEPESLILAQSERWRHA